MTDLLIVAMLPATFAVVLGLGALEDHRFLASLPGPRTPVPTRQVIAAELPHWATTPGPAMWSAGRVRTTPHIMFEDPPRPDLQARQPKLSRLADVAAAVPEPPDRDPTGPHLVVAALADAWAASVLVSD